VFGGQIICQYCVNDVTIGQYFGRGQGCGTGFFGEHAGYKLYVFHDTIQFIQFSGGFDVSGQIKNAVLSRQT